MKPDLALSTSGAVCGAPRILLRLEAVTVLAGAVLAYHWLGGGWGRFAALFLVPDLSMLAYLAGARWGAVCYNAAHSYIGPGLLAVLALSGAMAPAGLVACIWAAHVGFDRALGYGLKYAGGFGDTHLGRIGRLDRRAVSHVTQFPD